MKKNYLIALLLLLLIMTTMNACGFDGKSNEDASAVKQNEVANPENDASEVEPNEILESDDSTSALESNEVAQTNLDNSAIEYNGVTVSIMDENMDNVLAAFGEPEDAEGNRPGYYYTFASGSVDVDSFIYNEIFEEKRQEFPDMIYLKDAKIKTSKGIGVGSTQEEVKAAYGEGEASSPNGTNLLRYSFGDYEIVFEIDKTVVGIQYIRKTFPDDKSE